MGEQCQDDKSLPCLTSISNILGNSDINYLNVETIINYFFIVASVIYLEFMTYILNQRRLKLEVPSEHHYAVLYKGDRTSTSAELYESLKELEISVEKTLGRKNRILKVGIIMRVYESDVIKKSQVITDGASGESSDHTPPVFLRGPHREAQHQDRGRLLRQGNHYLRVPHQGFPAEQTPPFCQ